MKHLSLFIISCLASVMASAQSRPSDLLTCTGKFDLVIRPTAVVTAHQGVLTISESKSISLVCLQTPEEVSFVCREARAGSGRFVVETHTDEATHMLSATILQEQMFPMKPKQMAVLDCTVPLN